jgi:hypothetical protein
MNGLLYIEIHSITLWSSIEIIALVDPVLIKRIGRALPVIDIESISGIERASAGKGLGIGKRHDFVDIPNMEYGTASD